MELWICCRLVWGEQGASNALAVAQQLGFDRAVLADAKEWKSRWASQGRESAEKGSIMQEEMLVHCSPCKLLLLLCGASAALIPDRKGCR
jgi:hypothetical protein